MESLTPRHHKRSARLLAICMACVASATFATSARAGLQFNVTYDASVNSAPAGFKTAFNDAIQFYESTYSDPITINMNVGWGEINGSPLNPGDLGQSLTNQQGVFTYAQVKAALIADAKSPADMTAVANLPANYPSNNFVMSNAEAKALGLLAGNAAGTDGWVGFDSTAPWTFDPNNRAVSGEYDFIGVAEHEISEVMGRYGLGQNGASSGRFSPIDLFRYLSPGTLDFIPANGDYFSIDGGNTNINTYNGTGGGDLSDWVGNTPDSYNAFLSQDTKEAVSAGDVTLMDVIGYDLAVVAAPEPASVTLLLSGLVLGGGFHCVRRRRQITRE